MAEIINYIWQSSFCLLFFFGVYWCFLKEEKTFNLTRVFILIAPILALLFPLIEIPVDFAKPSISLEHTEFLQSLAILEGEEEIVGTYGLPEFTVEGTKLPLLMELKDYLIIGYLVLVLLLGLRLVWQFMQINCLLRKGWYQTVFKLKGNYFLVPTFGLAPVFSYFDKLFWDDTQKLSLHEKEQIIQHEMEHIRQRHSWDIVYYQVLSMLFWFNPAIHLMRAALVDTHEFLADARVLQRTENKESYRKLIVKIAFKGLDLPIGNYFIRSTTLKRIMMMKKSSKINWIKLVMVIPLTAMLLALVSMKTLPDSQLLAEYLPTNITLIKQQIKAAHDSIQVSTKVKRIKSPVHYEYISSLKNGKITAQFGDLQYEIGEISNIDEYRKVLEMLQVFKTNFSFKKDYGKTDLVSKADKMPIPEGGIEVWNKFLSNNLKMPAEARELGVAGYVYAQFIIDKEGKITSPTIKKSLGMGLDDEVLRILTLPSAPQWIPGEKDGKVVNTLMTIPVKFKSEQRVVDPSFFPSPPTLSGATKMLNGEKIYDVVQKMPQPPGGMEGWNNYLYKNIKYPEAARIRGIEGTVYVVFVVDTKGKLVNPTILRGIGGGADEEAIRLVLNSPNWTPGLQNGQKVNVKMRLPIRFTIPPNAEKEESKSLSDPAGKTMQDETLKEVVVIGYGSAEDYISKNTSEKNTIEIILKADGMMFLNGKQIKPEEFTEEITGIIGKFATDNVEKNQIVADIKADGKTKLGQVHDIQDMLKKLGIHKVKYSNLP